MEVDGGVREQLNGIAKEVGEIRVLVAGMMPRAEIDGELARRVSMDAYVSDQAQVKDRLTKLEASPQRLLAWIGVGGGCLGVLISALMATVTIIGLVIAHYKP